MTDETTANRNDQDPDEDEDVQGEDSGLVETEEPAEPTDAEESQS